MRKLSRRSFLQQLGLGAGAAIAAPHVIGVTRAAGASASQALRHNIEHVVVIFQENRSFDHYFGTFQPKNGQQVVNLLNANGQIDSRFVNLQKNPAGIPYANLPLPTEIPSFTQASLPNRPFHLAPYIPANGNVRWDPKHRFFRMMAEVNNGKMDLFVALAGSSHQHLHRDEFRKMSPAQIAFELARPSGPVIGYYEAADLPFYHRVAHEYVLFDHFYQAMSGGSTGNALYLAACRSCVNPQVADAHVAPFDPKEAGLQHAFFDLPYDHRRVMVNDLPPVQGPTNAGEPEVLQISPPPAAQTYDNIGDRLSAAKVDWAWYNENWNRVKPWALKTAFGPGDGSAVVDTSQLYVAHHNPFQYYPRWPEYVRAGHMRDAEDFLEDARQGRLPGVSFLKASAAHDEHPADSAPAVGMDWVERLVRAVAEGPAWEKTAIFITYDEGGGFWDSLPPKVVDDYGFGTRIPALLISPWARSGLVDHHLASTASILKFIETRFGLAPLTERDRNAYDLLGAFDWDQKPGALRV
ncbi:alkaline phosphatase family protein [Candidatus Igneacidithiobacillus taiwanensis]|uniref:alkaline phosphatase family protein n=1 Tax=Candidatus Igneacidithiobacillus taiwanensis TaxID=1945924 RepID=UPI00289BED21|nr:alkaline phosphatase family protein [Candidatus Igneacidithiobacillus taiwanensis]